MRRRRSFRYLLSPTVRQRAALVGLLSLQCELYNAALVSAGNRRGPVFECQACGHKAHADTNAAINILRAGRAQQPAPA